MLSRTFYLYMRNILFNMTKKDFLEKWLLMALINSDCVLTALLYEGCVENH